MLKEISLMSLYFTIKIYYFCNICVLSMYAQQLFNAYPTIVGPITLYNLVSKTYIALTSVWYELECPTLVGMLVREKSDHTS